MGFVPSLNWPRREGWVFFFFTRHFKSFCKKAKGKYVRKICEQVCPYHKHGVGHDCGQVCSLTGHGLLEAKQLPTQFQTAWLKNQLGYN